ncbi:hypothetical protein GMORB2_7759 [Geosmithia morbida]|uniref:Uncharacterized protein n=1 Tax=Geosmithia morbida TaxID=1094350 RepID=A0A9P4YS81_9HYPO|nr:uncharacterized protein GMORB2_7759 [Geosmithia morbida]KAF4122166.1 hypothetical protein GMORB2_7759 [Geosmithia morbida]
MLTFCLGSWVGALTDKFGALLQPQSSAESQILRMESSRAVEIPNVSSAHAVYAAARMYNSGSVDYADLNDGITSASCYLQGVANRLTGWSLAASPCSV